MQKTQKHKQKTHMQNTVTRLGELEEGHEWCRNVIVMKSSPKAKRFSI